MDTNRPVCLEVSGVSQRNTTGLYIFDSGRKQFLKEYERLLDVPLSLDLSS